MKLPSTELLRHTCQVSDISSLSTGPCVKLFLELEQLRTYKLRFYQHSSDLRAIRAEQSIHSLPTQFNSQQSHKGPQVKYAVTKRFLCLAEWPHMLWQNEDRLHHWLLCGHGQWSAIWRLLSTQVSGDTSEIPLAVAVVRDASGARVSLCNCRLIYWNSPCRYGLRGRELINNVGKVMVQGGGTFGTFMAIGTGIRCWCSSSLTGGWHFH